MFIIQNKKVGKKEKKILSRVGVTIRRVMVWMIGLTFYALQAITALSLIYTIYSSPLHTH
jgi:hypothetical protein